MTMKRVWRFSSDAAQAQLFLSQFHGKSHSTKPRIVPSFIARQVNTLSNGLSEIAVLFTAKPGSSSENYRMAILRNQLVRESSDSVRVRKILDENSEALNLHQPGGHALLELLYQLNSNPSLALQVFNWRRKNSNVGNPMNYFEYSKGIKLAGRCKNVDFAFELFKEASTKGLRSTSTYNALMAAYMFNGLADRCQSLFCDMKRDPTCNPSIATYNILLSVFGSLMLVDYMEATFQEINKLHLDLNICTYNYLISGYIAAWMWNDMEKAFQMLKSSPVRPNLKTYLLMLRGYAHSGNLEKMEEMYSLVRDHVNEKEIPLLRSMICAYCKSNQADKIRKIEVLLKLIPEEEYRPWLNVLLIKLYAREHWIEEMENALNVAFEHGTPVTTVSIMKCIITTYFRSNALDKLENFVRRAESFGWRSCRSLYHCKLVMLGGQHHLNKMQDVLWEMESVNLGCTKKTLWIMYKVYFSCGQKSMVLKTLGQMFKHGHEVPLHAFPS
ncbi:pentatricopeptide repeat-containing protein At2g30780-like [Abrus precatorius]|uniref:Pentatricopeptide repeat-containing protein At2g30780-like n=1 Tax=Abrus precatorius TaxID=3816 RepID=A0A8B8KYT1_ABRPR|nr:pentatricopeptide repeat-containing protein At2g30780-like [Abrus precatorius]